MRQIVFFSADRDRRGRGVALYIKKKSLQYKVILQKLDAQLEKLWISMIISGKKYVLGVLYMPPSGNILQFINELENSMSEVLPYSDVLLISGDLNINLLYLNQSVHQFNNFLESYDLSQL